jgi:S1-C subfamily serine protease
MPKLPNPSSEKKSNPPKYALYLAIGVVAIALGLIAIPFLDFSSIGSPKLESTQTLTSTSTPIIIRTPYATSIPTLDSLTPILSQSIVQVTARERGNFTVPENGTGIIISEDGLILTNAHVVMNGNIDDSIIVTLTRGDRKIEKFALIKGIFPCDDIALIDIEGNGYIPIPDVATLPISLGSEVFLLGYGHGTLITEDTSLRFSQGTVSRPRTSFSPFPILIEHSITLLPADSGSPLFDRSGQLIGINFAMDIQGRGGNIAYAIDYQRIKEILPLLIEQKAPEANYIIDIISEDVTTTLPPPPVKRLVDYFDRHCYTINIGSNRDLIIQVTPQDSHLFRPIVSIYDWRNQLHLPPTELNTTNNFTIISELTLNGRYTVVVGRTQTTTTGADKLGDYLLTIHQEN